MKKHSENIVESWLLHKSSVGLYTKHCPFNGRSQFSKAAWWWWPLLGRMPSEHGTILRAPVVLLHFSLNYRANTRTQGSHFVDLLSMWKAFLKCYNYMRPFLGCWLQGIFPKIESLSACLSVINICSILLEWHKVLMSWWGHEGISTKPKWKS